MLEERHRIDVDCRRTDRAVSLFAQPPKGKAATARYAIISPQNDEIGAQSPSNEHTEQLAAILLTYGFYERELGMYDLDPLTWQKSFTADGMGWLTEGNEGYVQGMSDLCAPIYVVMGGEPEMTFWCFAEVMNRMVSSRLVQGASL